MRSVLAAVAAILLAACTPEYNWREIRSPEHGWSAMLPGKPAEMTRRIRLDTLDVSMTMQGAKVGDTSFTVASVALPDDRAETRAQALAAMRAGMLRNIAGRETASREVRVRVVDAAGAPVGELPAQRVEAAGSANGRSVTMSAGFAADGARAWQWVVLGPAVDAEQAAVFADSFRPIRVAQ